MPGKRITDHQVHKYKQHRHKLTQVASAAKAGISERSARRIDDAPNLPSQRPERNWRTREDPLSVVWDRSGRANLNSEISGNSGHDAGLRMVWREGVFDGQEIGTTHAANTHAGV